jgi:dimethylaniline monooxygenase (N-oxide forming)
MSDPRVCVIGAGSSGIATAKVLHGREIPFDVYEVSDRVGGNWVFGNANGMSSSYRSLHINTSRERMEYSDFPMPKSYPDFPHHTQIAAYFDAYVDHFGFRDRIRFATGVEHVARRDDGRWDVRTTTGETVVYAAVAVANGHHWDPRWPEPPFPGHDRFEGEQLHAHHYRTEDQLAGRDVVVLGMGNSAMDIAVDASYAARTTYLAARRGAHVIPKYLFGRPIDQIGAAEWLPGWVRFPMFGLMLRLAVGSMETYGLPRPDHKFAHAHPTISGRILDRLAHGAIVAKPNIAALEGDRVRFADGSSVHADLVIYCTGYRITFPFLDPELLAAPGNEVPLYRHVFHPDVDGLYFVGLVQPLGAVMPIAERQSELIADHVQGRHALPPAPEMWRSIRRERARMRRRYVASARHTIQVDFDDYMRALRKERQTGAERAASSPGASDSAGPRSTGAADAGPARSASTSSRARTGA